MKEMSTIDAREEEETVDSDIEIIGEIPTLDGKSVEENQFQNADEASWMSIQEEEIRVNRVEPTSCVAMRTRSHTEIRKMETSLFYSDDEDSGFEKPADSREIKDSFSMYCTNKEQ